MSIVRNRLAAFDPFTFDFAERLLKRADQNIDLPPRTAEILEYLIENRERWISKAELTAKFWPGVKVVSEDSVHRQIADIRRALGDSAEDSKFIQTKYKVGWRFAANVTEAAAIQEEEPLTENRPALDTAPPPIAPPRTRRFAQAVPILILLFAGAVLLFRSKPARTARIIQPIQLTWDGKAKTGPLLTDGHSIFFREGVQEMSVPVAGGDATPAKMPPIPDTVLRGITSDRSKFLLYSWKLRAFSIYSTRSQSIQTVASNVYDAALSPDGQKLTISQDTVFSIKTLDGKVTARLELGKRAGSLQWSPDSQTVRFDVADFPGGLQTSMWEYSSRRGSATRLFGVTESQDFLWSGAWNASGRYFFYVAGLNLVGGIWVRPEPRFSLFHNPQPELLTSSAPGAWSAPAAVPGEEQSLFAIHHYTRSELVRLDAKSKVWSPIWNQKPASELSYSNDGNWVAYTMLPDCSIWKAHPDGSAAVRLTAAGKETHQAHWSPDGKQIAFMGQNAKNQWAVFRIGAEGGVPEELATGDDAGVPTWSPDGRSLIFGERLSKKPRAEMVIRKLDLASHKISELPGTRGLWSPRWSPDGKYILALTSDSKTLRLQTLPSASWQDLITLRWLDNATWSTDSRFIYFDGADPDNHRWLFRAAIPSGRIERLIGLDDAKTQVTWYGVDQTGTPLALRDTTVDEIFKLKCELP